MFQSMVREGIASGELIEVDWMQMVLSALGGNVFYFLSAPVWRLIVPIEPFDTEVAAGAPRRDRGVSRAGNFQGSYTWRRTGRESSGRLAHAGFRRIQGIRGE